MSRPSRLPVLAAATLAATALSLALAQPATTISLEVGAGPHQGSYQVSSQDVTCTYGYAGEGLWGNQYSIDASSAETFSSLQLIVDTRKATEGTGEFLTTLSFGPLFTPQSTSYTIDTANDVGSGFLTLDDRGGSATVHISGESGEGIPFEATIECHRVLRSGPSPDQMDQEAAEAAPGPLALTIGTQNFEFAPTSEEASCAEGLAEEYDFQYTYYPLDGEGEISSVEVYFYDIRRPEEAGIYVTVYGEAHEFYVDTSPDAAEGSSVATVQRDGGRRTVSVSGTTTEGVPFQVQLECAVD